MSHRLLPERTGSLTEVWWTLCSKQNIRCLCNESTSADPLLSSFTQLNVLSVLPPISSSSYFWHLSCSRRLGLPVLLLFESLQVGRCGSCSSSLLLLAAWANLRKNPIVSVSSFAKYPKIEDTVVQHGELSQNDSEITLLINSTYEIIEGLEVNRKV